MLVEWSEQARIDLRAILAYIAERNLLAAESLYERIEQSISHLPQHPYLYKQSPRVLGAREVVVHPNYVVYYRVKTDAIEILSVVHSSQDYP